MTKIGHNLHVRGTPHTILKNSCTIVLGHRKLSSKFYSLSKIFKNRFKSNQLLISLIVSDI